MTDLDGPALIVAQNTFARNIVLDKDGHWEVKDQYNSGRGSAQILAAAALDTDGDGTKEIVLLDKTSKSLLFLDRARTASTGPAGRSRSGRSTSRACTSPTSTATAATTCCWPGPTASASC